MYKILLSHRQCWMNFHICFFHSAAPRHPSEHPSNFMIIQQLSCTCYNAVQLLVALGNHLPFLNWVRRQILVSSGTHCGAIYRRELPQQIHYVLSWVIWASGSTVCWPCLKSCSSPVEPTCSDRESGSGLMNALFNPIADVQPYIFIITC